MKKILKLEKTKKSHEDVIQTAMKLGQISIADSIRLLTSLYRVTNEDKMKEFTERIERLINK